MATVRLNITMDEALYRRLKRELPSRRISGFVTDAVRARMSPDRARLDAAYRAASQEKWRRALAGDWSVTEAEQWPG
jgi:hypothetical protein